MGENHVTKSHYHPEELIYARGTLTYISKKGIRFSCEQGYVKEKDMDKSVKFLVSIICGLGLYLGIFALGSPSLAANFSYGDYAAALKAFVNDQGMVNYRGLKASPQQLNAFVAALGQVDPQVYRGWGDKEKIAFWINAYNALTLKAIIDHYPIQSSFFGSFAYPRNSIRQIPGVWDKLRFRVMGREMTLDEIEHATLRKEFNEPRIHLALVCAAMGCPPLRNEPYIGKKLDQQLDDQARHFLANPRKFAINRDQSKVYLSPIFKWFGEDFVKTYGTDREFAKFSPAERAVLNYFVKFVNEKDREYLLQGSYAISYLDYDWSLNEQ
jgi:hypothetical protein